MKHDSFQSHSKNSEERAVSAKNIFAIALPALGVLAAMPIYLLIDTAFVGRLGTVELAALGAGTTVQGALTTQLTFLSYGTTARSSRLYGAGDRPGAVAEGVQATWVGIGVGVVLAFAVWVLGPHIALGLTGNADTAELATSWLRISACAIPLTLIVMAGNGWLRGVQNTRLTLIFTLAGLVPGALCVPLFVHWWGLNGSAIANLVGFLIIASLFLSALVKQHDGSWKVRPKVIIRQLVLGRDLIVRSLAFQVAFISAAAVAARFGSASLAAHQVLLQLWNFLALILDSLAIAAQSLIGAALGANNASHARAVGVRIVLYSTLFSATLATVFALGNGLIPRLFTSDAVVLERMSIPWWIMVGMVVLGGVLFALDGVLLGAGDAAYLRTITIASVVFGFLPGIAIAYVSEGGLPIIWAGLALFILIRTIAVAMRFQSMKWAK